MKLASRFGRINQIRRDRPLTNDELMAHVPSVFCTDKHESRSDRYTYIPTITLLDSLKREGFQPFFACQTRVRDQSKREHTKHMLAFRIRMEQASPVRAMVQTRDGQWHVGSTWVKASGGGCTVPGITRADGSWVKNLNQVQTKFFYNPVDGSRRLRLRVMHPMDTGLVAGIPAFHIEELRMVDAVGEVWWSLALHEPVSENPLITLELPSQGGQGFRLLGRDNNGNRIDAEVVA